MPFPPPRRPRREPERSAEPAAQRSGPEDLAYEPLVQRLRQLDWPTPSAEAKQRGLAEIRKVVGERRTAEGFDAA